MHVYEEIEKESFQRRSYVKGQFRAPQPHTQSVGPKLVNEPISMFLDCGYLNNACTIVAQFDFNTGTQCCP